MQTILGSGGAIGTPLARELAHYTNQVRLVARRPVKVNDDDELFPADLLDADAVSRAVQGSEVVYLTVGLAYNIKVWRRDWPALMTGVINACLKHNAALVFLDNVYMYSPTAIYHMTEQSAVAPQSKKGKVRALLVNMIMDAVHNRGLKALIARSADFYGPGIANSPLGITVLDKFLTGQKAFWQADAGKIHSFTYTPDAAKALALLGNNPDTYGQIWHLPTSSEKWTGKDFIEKVAAELKVKPRYYTLSSCMMSLVGTFVPMVRELKEMVYQYDRDYFFDSTKIEQHLGVIPTSYASGIATIVARAKKD